MTKRLGPVGAALSGGMHRSFVRDVGAVSLVRLIGGALLFSSQVLVAGWLGPLAFGVYSFAWSCVAVLGALAAFGLPATVVRFIAAYRESNSSSLIWGLLKFSRTVTIGFALSIAAVTMTSTASIASDSPYYWTLQFALLAVPMLAFLNLEAAFARAFAWMTLSAIGEQIGRPVLLMVFGWILVESFGLRSAPMLAAACTLAYFVVAISQHAVLRRRIKATVKPSLPELQSGPWLRMSSSVFLLNSALMLRTNADLLLVGGLIGPLDLGIYTAAIRTATLVSFVLTITSIVVQPSLSASHTSKRQEELQQFFAAATRLTFLLSLAAAALLAIAGPSVLSLFGSEFTAGYPALIILLAGHVAAARFGPVTSLLVMTGHQRTAAWTQAGSTVLTVLLIVALIAPFGVIGAATAVALSAAGTQLALHAAARRRLDFHLPRLDFQDLMRYFHSWHSGDDVKTPRHGQESRFPPKRCP
jgi:O-antigen/teichoic acid export membrane protein